MFYEVVTDTNIVFYLMIAVGVLGVLAKAVNLITLRRMVWAAGNMQKSTHKLIKLVRAKYEHALMLHDRVENAEAFVEKYIYEYRGFLLRIHTWRQLEVQSIWFSGILAAFGGVVWYMENGFCEEMYRYISLGAAEMVLLFVVSQLSDEQYKIEAAKNYMVDYLENVCAMRRRKTRQSEKGPIDIIQPEASQALRPNGREAGVWEVSGGREASGGGRFMKGREMPGGTDTVNEREFPAMGASANSKEAPAGIEPANGREAPVSGMAANSRESPSGKTVLNGMAASGGNGTVMRKVPANGKRAAGVNRSPDSPELSISIEGEPRRPETEIAEDLAPAYMDAGGTGIPGNGYRAEDGGRMRRIPGRFQDVVQRMAGDPYQYEEILEGPPLPDEARESAGLSDTSFSTGNRSQDESGRAAEYYETGRACEDEEELREYEKGRNRARKKGDAARQVIRRTMKGNLEQQEEEPALKEEAIRQILEEFLA